MQENIPMDLIEIPSQVLDSIKIIAIVFSVLHFFFGFIIFRQTNRMTRILKTHSSKNLVFIGTVYLLLLLTVVILVVLA